jgi:4-amino-4-deoxy-L-arabinose transferase-like glycosyltransferase
MPRPQLDRDFGTLLEAQQPLLEAAPARAAGEAPRLRRAVVPDRRPSPRDWSFAALSALVGLWALFQNLYKIGTAPILADEPGYVGSGWSYVHGDVQPPLSGAQGRALVANADNFEHPPLGKYLFGLAELISGTPDSLTAARVVSATATLVAAAAAALWLGRTMGRWTGLLAATLLTLLPESANGSNGRFDRFAMLDPVASMFMVISVILAWEWARRTGRAAWVYAILTGIAVGCASGSKENGFLGAVGPALVVVLVAVSTRRRDEIPARCGQAATAVIVSLGTFVGLYLPVGQPIARISYLIDFQSAQSALGHEIGFAGRVSSWPPWWANLWFAGHDYGSVLTVFLVVCVVCAFALRRDRLVGWCAATLAAPFVFHCFVAHVALGYYWVMWTPMFLALAAIGATEVIRLASKARRLRTAVVLATGAAVLVVPITQSAIQSATVAEIQPNGPQVVPSLMHEYGLGGAIVSTGVAGWAWSYYLPGTKVYDTASGPVPGAETVVVAQPQCRDQLDPSLRALVAVNLATRHIKEIYSDSTITVYAATGPLSTPTTAQIRAEPVSEVTEGC